MVPGRLLRFNSRANLAATSRFAWVDLDAAFRRPRCRDADVLGEGTKLLGLDLLGVMIPLPGTGPRHHGQSETSA